MSSDYTRVTIGWFAVAYGINLICVITLYALFIANLNRISLPRLSNVSLMEAVLLSLILLIAILVPKPSQINAKFIAQGIKSWLLRLLVFAPIIAVFFTT